MPADAIQGGDANLLVIRVQSKGGLRVPPILIAGNSTISLKGRWQMRLGDDPRWSNMPLPAKFGASPDIVFRIE